MPLQVATHEANELLKNVKRQKKYGNLLQLLACKYLPTGAHTRRAGREQKPNSLNCRFKVCHENAMGEWIQSSQFSPQPSYAGDADKAVDGKTVNQRPCDSYHFKKKKSDSKVNPEKRSRKCLM